MNGGSPARSHRIDDDHRIRDVALIADSEFDEIALILFHKKQRSPLLWLWCSANRPGGSDIRRGSETSHLKAVSALRKRNKSKERSSSVDPDSAAFGIRKILYSLPVASLFGATLHTRSEVSKLPPAFSLQSSVYPPCSTKSRRPSPTHEGRPCLVCLVGGLRRRRR